MRAACNHSRTLTASGLVADCRADISVSSDVSAATPRAQSCVFTRSKIRRGEHLDTRHQALRHFSRTRGNSRVTMRTQRPRIFQSFHANIVTSILSASFEKNVRPQRARANSAETSFPENLVFLDKSSRFASSTFLSIFEEHHRAQFSYLPSASPPRVCVVKSW
jgi:hypothetical protein